MQKQKPNKSILPRVLEKLETKPTAARGNIGRPWFYY